MRTKYISTQIQHTVKKSKETEKQNELLLLSSSVILSRVTWYVRVEIVSFHDLLFDLVFTEAK